MPIKPFKDLSLVDDFMFSEVMRKPENVKPFSIVVLGDPAETPKQPERHNPERIHWEKW